MAAVKEVDGPRHRRLHRRAGHRDPRARRATPSPRRTRSSRSSPTRRRWTSRRRSPGRRRGAAGRRSATRSRRARRSLTLARQGRRAGAPTEAAAPGGRRHGRSPRRDGGRGRDADGRAAAEPDASRAAERPTDGPASTRARPCAAWRASSASTCDGHGHRAQGPDHERGPRGRRRRSAGAAAAPRRRGRSTAPWPKLDFARYGEVERVPLAADPASLGARTSRATGSDDPARHPPRGRRHHRPRGVPQAAQRRAVRREGDDGRAAAEGGGRDAATRSRAFNSSLDGDELVLKPQLPPRLRRRHAERARRARSSATSTRRACSQLAAELTELSGKARAGKLGPTEMSGADVHDLDRSAASAARRSRRSSTRRRWRSSASCARR